MTKREDWQPGDPLPGGRRGVHTGPMFKLKKDHEDECETYGDGEWTWPGTAARWVALPEEER